MSPVPVINVGLLSLRHRVVGRMSTALLTPTAHRKVQATVHLGA